MTFSRKLTIAIFLVTCGLFCATPAKADGLVFSNFEQSQTDNYARTECD